MKSLLLLAAAATAPAAPVVDATPSTAAVTRAPATAAPAPALPAFGGAVAIAENVAFVGEAFGPNGLVHIYVRDGAAWRAAGTLSAPDASRNDGFGTALATDGRTLLVGQVDGAASADSARGRVHVFSRAADGTWQAAGVLTETERARGNGFGAALAMAGDLAFIGAPGNGAGAVHVFRRGADGVLARVGALPTEGLVEGDDFGAAIAAAEGRVVVGAPGENVGRGAAMVFAVDADGTARLESTMTPGRVPEQTGFGRSVAIAGGQIAIGAPRALPMPSAGRRATVGTVTVFEYRPVGGIWKQRQVVLPYEGEGAQFGAALAGAGDELWVGAPLSQRRAGRVYRLVADATGRLQPTPLAVEVEAGAAFGQSIAVHGDHAVVGMPADGGNLGTVAFLERTGDGWVLTATEFPAPPAATLTAQTGKEALCEGGSAGQFGCGNASVLSFLPIEAIGGKRGSRINDSWGWTDPTSGAEIAIVGRTDGTSFIDVTDPVNPRYLGNLPKTKGQPSAAWRDMKVYKDHVFIVADNAGEHGMQVFDLTRLRGVTEPQEFTPDVLYDRVNSAHNIVSNEETGFMYIVGGSGGAETCGGGYHMIDVREPKQPKFAGCYGDPLTGRAGTGYSHDAQCVVYHGPDAAYAGREICIGSNETALSIADVTDKSAPKAISRATYPNVAYAHQAWLTDDHQYLYMNDEGDESRGEGKAGEGTRTLVWDLRDLDDPVLVKEHVGTTKAIDHNLYVVGDRMYQANYTSGLRILDVSDPANPKEVGYVDTYAPETERPTFAGAWSVYPYFKSGTIVISSIGEGVVFAKDRTRPVVQ